MKYFPQNAQSPPNGAACNGFQHRTIHVLPNVLLMNSTDYLACCFHYDVVKFQATLQTSIVFSIAESISAIKKIFTKCTVPSTFHYRMPLFLTPLMALVLVRHFVIELNIYAAIPIIHLNLQLRI